MIISCDYKILYSRGSAIVKDLMTCLQLCERVIYSCALHCPSLNLDDNVIMGNSSWLFRLECRSAAQCSTLSHAILYFSYKVPIIFQVQIKKHHHPNKVSKMDNLDKENKSWSRWQYSLVNLWRIMVPHASFFSCYVWNNMAQEALSTCQFSNLNVRIESCQQILDKT